MNVLAYIPGQRPDIKDSLLESSYVQGRVKVENGSKLIGADIRNDEHDGTIRVSNSQIMGTVHCTTGEERYDIKNTLTKSGSITHGSNLDSVIQGYFSTIDLTDAENAKVGDLSYIISDQPIGGRGLTTQFPRGTFLIDKNGFYLRVDMANKDVDEAIQTRLHLRNEYVLDQLYEELQTGSPNGGFINPYAKFTGSKAYGNNFVAQRAAVFGSRLGTGTNVQEGCILQNVNTGKNTTFAHGAMALNSEIGSNCFVGFNGYLQNVTMDDNAILLGSPTVKPTEDKRVHFQPGIYVGMIRTQKDADKARENFDRLLQKDVSAQKFYQSFMNRLHHIQELNGGLPGANGHAQNHHALKYERI